MGLLDECNKEIQKRRTNLLNGYVNCIPSPFKRFSEDLCGIEKGMFYLISAPTKGSKSQFTNFFFVFNPLLYALENPMKAKVKIFYYPLEETDKKLMYRFASYMMFIKHNIIVSPKELLSTTAALPQNVLDIYTSPSFQRYLKWFEDHVTISKNSDPRSINKQLVDYAVSHGTVVYEVDENGNDILDSDGEKIVKSYTPDDPTEYRIIVTDHVSLLDEIEGKSLKSSIDVYSKSQLKLRNNFDYIIAMVQQQGFAGEQPGIKEVKGEPSRAGLSDSKYPSRDCNMMLTLYAPSHYKIMQYERYDISKLKDRVRFLSVAANRDGQVGGTIALRFIGECAFFSELPRVDDRELEKYYNNEDIVGKKIFSLNASKQTQEEKKTLKLFNIIHNAFS